MLPSPALQRLGLVLSLVAIVGEDFAKEDEKIFLTKSDVVEPAVLKKYLAAFKKIKKTPIPISILDEDSLNEVKKILNKIQAEK